jgi:predicted kinase
MSTAATAGGATALELARAGHRVFATMRNAAAVPELLAVADQAAQALHDRRTLTVTLIVVSGAPGTGKSTIAAALGAALRFPVLSLDPIKEALADVLGLGGEDWSNQVGDAAAEVVFRLAAAFPDAVAEGWWRGPRRDRALGEFADATEVFCHCDPRLASDRAKARIGHGRHPIHRDVINPAMAARPAELAATVTPLRLGAGLIEVGVRRSPDGNAPAEPGNCHAAQRGPHAWPHERSWALLRERLLLQLS